METLLLVGKWILGGLGVLLTAAIGWNFKRTNDTFTKDETTKLIREIQENHSKETGRLITSLDKLNENINNLNIKIAVLETKTKDI